LKGNVVLGEIFTWTFIAYAVIGLLFAVWFAFFGVNGLDPAARGAGVWFRLFIIPGSAALWPGLFFRVIRGSGIPVERNAHRLAAEGREAE